MHDKSSDLKLAVFDYDGTLTLDGEVQIAEAAFLGVQRLRHKGVATSIITARPYQRLVTISGGIEKIVSPGTPLATDRGARIVTGDKKANLRYHPLKPEELRAIVNLPKNGIEFIGFYPEELYGTSYIWAPEANHDLIVNKFSDAVVLASEADDLYRALRHAKPCLVTIKFEESSSSNNSLLPEYLNIAWDSRTASVITRGVDKCSAFKALCEAARTSFDEALYAGNDSSDLPVLCLPGLNERIFVGSAEPKGILEPVTRVVSASALGEYLCKS